MSKDDLIEDLMKQNAPLFDSVLSNIDQNRLQIIYTQIDRKKNGKPAIHGSLF